MDKHITLPITKEVSKTLKAGDYCYLSGEMYVARDAAHKKLIQMLKNNEKFKLVSDLAMELGEFKLAEEVMIKSNDFNDLLLYLL